MRVTDIKGFWKSVRGYCASEVLDADESIQAASVACGKKSKMCILYRSMCTVLNDLGSSGRTGFDARTRNNETKPLPRSCNQFFWYLRKKRPKKNSTRSIHEKSMRSMILENGRHMKTKLY